MAMLLQAASSCQCASSAAAGALRAAAAVVEDESCSSGRSSLIGFSSSCASSSSSSSSSPCRAVSAFRGQRLDDRRDLRSWAAGRRGSGKRGGSLTVRASRRGRQSGPDDSKAVYDAFFLGKALAETINERVGSAVGEFLSDVGRRQAEQRKRLQEFEDEVKERAAAAAVKAAKKAQAIEKEKSPPTAPPPSSPSPAQPPPSTSGLSDPAQANPRRSNSEDIGVSD